MSEPFKPIKELSFKQKLQLAALNKKKKRGADLSKEEQALYEAYESDLLETDARNKILFPIAIAMGIGLILQLLHRMT
jgi:hypothetical protein